MRQGWREVASDGAFGGMSRGWRQRRCCLAEAAAEVEPEDSDAGAVSRTDNEPGVRSSTGYYSRA